MTELTEDKVILGFEQLCSIPNISHFVTTRKGGYSEDTFASFNCAPFSGDDLEKVKRNQEVLCAKVGIQPQQLVIPFQTHGNTIRAIDPFYVSLSVEEQQRRLHGVDALITNIPGYCLCVSTADCVPVLLYDTVNKAIAVIHAGWRGTVAKIVKQTLDFMDNTYNTDAKDVLVAIGPSISFDAFEVGEEVYSAFLKIGYDMTKISSWNEDTQKHHIDLWEANRIQLTEAGVLPDNIEVSGICTYEQHERFFSARRLGTKSGRVLSGIMLKK
nr:peptidoglycan editing factor PgeF [uncultured Bacteroides sp.]